ncbi:MAG TPA: error-prone DNA polymerase [Phycisphaerales bacterium]|nr:error-prone DNA polymerase [Phycisphaerales bacterium]
MPDSDPKARVHPFKLGAKERPPSVPSSSSSPDFVELVTRSNYTFLTGASHPEELFTEGAAHGYGALGIADTNTLAGIVRAHCAAKDAGMRCIVGSRLILADPAGIEIAVYPTDRAAYGQLCRLLTAGKRRAPKGKCHLTLDDVAQHATGLVAIAIPPSVVKAEYEPSLHLLRDIFDHDRLSLAASIVLGATDAERLDILEALSRRTGTPLVATNDVLYQVPQRRPLQDVVTCIRLGTTIQAAGYALHANAERHLKPPEEVARLFRARPQALARSLAIAQQTNGFTLDQLRYEYPDEVCPEGLTPDQYLRALTEEGARERYPDGLPDLIREKIEHELALIADLRYAPYFLTVHDIVRFARSRGILCQGRGAAANSAVCYCLGVTSVDPGRINLLFERFVSRERNEPPDIDIDFEHERREEVLQYIYGKYGRERAALTAEVISYRGKSAIRDVGKAMGLSLDCVDNLAKTLGWWEKGEIPADRLRELGLDPNDRTLRLVLLLADQIQGFPRHLSQHVGGFVITRGPLCESVPIENAAMDDRTIIEWDKDDIDAMGMLKVDCLGLGMLTCIRKCFELVKHHHGHDLTLANVPQEDPAVYDMICRADTIGVFQIESRAQMSMLPRLKPRTFYDLVIEVAIVRPGPIQGNMVHPYLRRRNREEKFSFPSPEVEKVLGRTLGVPLFQEQAMAMAIVAGGFSPGDADKLRRAMAAWKRKGDLIFRFGKQLIDGMLKNGYTREFAERCFEQIKGFSEYGFPESHAASFALLVYVSCWLKHHYPAAFAAALINSQPMGFYAPAQIVRDAKEHGVAVREIEVNHSGWDCTLEDGAIRLGMRLVNGLAEADADLITQARALGGRFATIDDLRRRTGLHTRPLRRLARADAFASMGLDRQHALWSIQALDDTPAPVFDDAFEHAPQDDHASQALLPFISEPQRVRHDYAATGLSLKAHPMSFVRDALNVRRVSTARSIQDQAAAPNGRRVSVAGLVLVRQRPATASGIVFYTIEDETGIANLIVKPDVYERHRGVAKLSASLCAWGRVERSGTVVHVLVSKLASLDELNEGVRSKSRDFH